MRLARRNIEMLSNHLLAGTVSSMKLPRITTATCSKRSFRPRSALRTFGPTSTETENVGMSEPNSILTLRTSNVSETPAAVLNLNFGR